jgi:hypothetical protein
MISFCELIVYCKCCELDRLDPMTRRTRHPLITLALVRAEEGYRRMLDRVKSECQIDSPPSSASCVAPDWIWIERAQRVAQPIQAMSRVSSQADRPTGACPDRIPIRAVPASRVASVHWVDLDAR